MQKNLACLIDVAHSVRDFPHGKAPVVRADTSSLLWLGVRIKECIKLRLRLPIHPCVIVLKHRDCTCVYLCMHVCIMHCTTSVKFVWTCCFISHVIWKCRLWTRELKKCGRSKCLWTLVMMVIISCIGSFTQVLSNVYWSYKVARRVAGLVTFAHSLLLSP
jgi:hypothetical protein